MNLPLVVNLLVCPRNWILECRCRVRKKLCVWSSTCQEWNSQREVRLQQRPGVGIWADLFIEHGLLFWPDALVQFLPEAFFLPQGSGTLQGQRAGGTAVPSEEPLRSRHRRGRQWRGDTQVAQMEAAANLMEEGSEERGDLLEAQRLSVQSMVSVQVLK